MIIVNDPKDAMNNMPTILYKYRTWKKESHKNLLKEGVVFFAAPEVFDDKLDCNVPEIFPSGLDLYSFFYKKSLETNCSFSQEQHIQFANHWAHHSPLANEEIREHYQEYFRKEFSNTHGILSLCLNPNNDYMWKNYGDNHQGYCVGFEVSELASHCCSGGIVEYCEPIPSIDYVNDSLEVQIKKTLFSKSKEYSIEEEYRFLIMKLGQHLTDEDRVVKLPNNCFKEIYLGEKMSSSDRNEIMDIIASKYPSTMVIQRKSR